MNHYKYLFFDVDNTLLDFNAAEELALQRLFDDQHINLTTEIERYYKEMNKGLWRDFENGKIDRDELVNTRFAKLFKAFGRDVDGVTMEQNYRRFLNEGHQLVSGARQLLLRLKERFDLYIVTNGVAETQRKRLQDSGLTPFFKQIFVSEDSGYHKPDPRFFHYVFKHIPCFRADHGLIVGDSLISDIQGGSHAGLKTCWFNAKHQNNELDVKPNYEIHKLDELYAILQPNE
ncbi:YjjG family noncanonical pyrimidine nucleotidase [Sporolactobacillus shoreicorticis]|uniref:YjjG family noncanonical pyrimidine nucleotidase n=1 Tax=Sporolactobacillus shoreicorticis TaxID=1923877 RepID=A0ABW5S628_9BACL|nr:YjjG family noncanonical pyrimidine nucleotidase [Sporolactobacillus shoreicorticis]MCO7125749.1 YjjG family noncanonical pyrimidine nucleotidase [Sporolactobacillus shoreicorticis]